MNPPRPSLARALLLLLVAIGPLQAQAVFACAMMGEVVQDECCCDDHDSSSGCESSSCHTAVQSGEEPCCERSVEISADLEARQDSLISKPVEVRSGMDPPHALITSFNADPTSRALPDLRDFYSTAAARGGSDTYLLTLRLRL